MICGIVITGRWRHAMELRKMSISENERQGQGRETREQKTKFEVALSNTQIHQESLFLNSF